jgi:hypothetical protein
MTILKKSVEDQMREMEIDRLTIKSRVQYQWNFRDDIEKLVESIEPLVAEQVLKNYGVEYTEYSNNSMRIKIKDKNMMIEKLISCNFTYKANDEKFGHITPQFIVTEKWQKTKNYEMKKHKLTNTDAILRDVMESLLEIIEEF